MEFSWNLEASSGKTACHLVASQVPWWSPWFHPLDPWIPRAPPCHPLHMRAAGHPRNTPLKRPKRGEQGNSPVKMEVSSLANHGKIWGNPVDMGISIATFEYQRVILLVYNYLYIYIYIFSIHMERNRQCEPLITKHWFTSLGGIRVSSNSGNLLLKWSPPNCIQLRSLGVYLGWHCAKSWTNQS